VLGKVLTWQGAFTYWSGRTDTAEQLVRNGLALLRETAVAEKRNLADRAWAVLCLGVVRIHSGFDDDAVRLREQSLALYRAAEDEWGTALLLGALGVMARESGAYDRAKRLGEESLALRRAVNDGWGTAAALDALGWIANARGKPEEAERLFREAIIIRQDIGTRGTALISELFALSWTLIQLGRFSEAHSVAQEALERCEDTGIRFFYPWASWNLGEAKLHLGDYEGARTQLQTGLDLLQESGEDRFLIANLAAIGSVSVALEAYPESCDYLEERITQVGEVQSWRVNYELAVALTVLAYAAHSLRQTAKARKYLCRALRPAMKTQNVFSGIQVLSAAALIMADATECAETEAVRAVELYALVSRYPLVANSRWYEDVVGKHIAAVAETLPPDEVAAAQDRGRALDLWETAEELLEGLHAPD
jgi:tetratricopeptide (TPR) repeat protein